MSDRKRVYGPSVSVPPYFEEPEQPVFTRTRDVDRCRKICKIPIINIFTDN